MKELIQKLASEQAEQLLEDRHHLHSHPELSFQEYETSKWIKDNLAKLGIPLEEGITGTSVVGVLKGDEPGPTVMFRADIDALPVQENNDLPYKSTVENVMHACGHDTHNATLMALARTLSAHKELVKGTVKFVFQAAEELLPGGATQLCKDGVMKDVDYGFGMHASAGLPLGTVTCTAGPVSAAVLVYEITVHGRGGHGSDSSKCINPMPIACMLGTALNQIKPECIPPQDPSTVTVSYIHGGKLPNIIAADCTLGGNVRLFNNDLIHPVADKIKQIAEGICATWGATCDCNITIGYPANICDKDLTDKAWSAIEELGYTPIKVEPSMGSEDFAYYAMEKPCTFIHVGGAVEGDIHHAHHSKDFILDENLMKVALECELGFYLKVTGQA